jgi:hypothetical protein
MKTKIVDGITIMYFPLTQWWVGKKFAGITLNGKIYIRQTTFVTDVLLRHEYIHVLQQQEVGFIPFLLRYIWEYIGNGYRGISFEKEAYLNDWKINYLNTREPEAWKKYR